MAKIIEASAVINARAGDLSGVDKLASKLLAASKAGETVKRALGGAAGDLGKKVEEISAKLGKIENFRGMARGLDSASMAMRKAQQDAGRLKAALDATEKPAKAMRDEYARAAQAVERASAAFRQQGQATREARSALEGAGIPIKGIAAQQAQLLNSLNATTAAMHRQAAAGRAVTGGGRLGARPTAAGAVPAGGHRADAGGGTSFIPIAGRIAGPVAAAYLANRAHSAVIDQHHDFQQAYLTQQAILGLDKGGQASLMGQAEKIGKDTKFSNADIVRAQTDIGGKLPKEMQKPSIIEAITENTKNYALAMKVSMEEGAEAVVGYMKSWGYDLSSPEAAAASSKRAANMLVEQAKTTGAKHHDLLGSTKFGAAPSRAGGFTEELTNAVQAQLIRVGYEGAMAGTFSRAVATKLAVPSRIGAAAIAGAGIEFGNYQRPGVDASASGLGEMLRQRFGRGLNKTQIAALQEVLDDPDVMASKGAFQEKTSEILGQTFARKTKAGKINVMDADRISKTTDQFYNVVSQGVDTPRLFMDLIQKGLTPALARYLFGQEHGGRAIGLDPAAIRRDWETNKNIPSDRASVVAAKMQEGAQGEWNKMIGSVQTFAVALGEASDAARAWGYAGVGSFFEYLTDVVKGKNIDPNVAKNMQMTPAGAPYKLDTWSSDAVGIYERSRRVDQEFRRDPEGSRGRAFMSLSNPGRLELVRPQEITAKVEGRAEVSGKFEVTASSELLRVVEQARQVTTTIPLMAGGGPGSTGTSMPEAAPSTGSASP